jgi:transcriptional regulator with XRE-family HTH domain
MTLEDLAESSGRHPTYIGQVERGTKKASLVTLTALASALDLHVRELFGAARTASDLPTSVKIDALLRSRSESERRVLLSTLRHLARGLKGLRTTRR